MAGYSSTPLAKKLGIKEGHRVTFPGAPALFIESLAPIPEGVSILKPTAKPLDLIVYFTKSRTDLTANFRQLASQLQPAGILWISWPKKASGIATDLTETLIREIGLAVGLVDTKICAIDETWSGLKFVYRLADRPKVAQRPR